MSGEAFIKYGHVIQISREMALDAGLVHPTKDEISEREERIAEWKAKKAEAQPRLHAALSALDALDGLARDVLDLHTFDRSSHSTTCEGCDFAGYECEPPDWPCRTVELIAERNGIDLEGFHLYDPKESA